MSSTRPFGSPVQDGRLRAAVRLVSDCWLPCNAQLKTELVTQAEHAQTPADLRSVLHAARKDVGLYFSCLRDFCDLLRRREGLSLGQGGLLTRFEEIDRQGLLEILRLPNKVSSPHELKNMKTVQAQVLQSAYLSASVSSTLAPHEGMSSDLGFSAAMLRQLGHLLLAWNYPRVYERATSKATSAHDVDLHIVKFLGFSPSLLAAQILAEWGLARSSLEIQLLSLDDDGMAQEYEQNATLANLRKLCKIGETFAKVQRFPKYLERRDDWQSVKRELDKSLGEDAWREIREQALALCESYQDLVPELFHPGTLFEMHAPLGQGELADEFAPERKNPFLALCREPFKQALLDYYDFAKISQEADLRIRYVFSLVLKKSEFQAASVFTVDPTTRMLYPQFAAGELEVIPSTPVDYSVSQSGSDTISIAYQTAEPVVTYEKGKSGKYVSEISGHFGVSQRLGVLSVETPLIVSDDLQVLTHFKALRWALQDCLELMG